MPPAAIGVVRVSGPRAGAALKALAGRLPEPRQASLAALKDTDGAPLDNALILWFPGPATATGEDLAELHLHGGRAVVAAVETALSAMPGLRRSEEHTSELQSLMRISYAVFCLKKKTRNEHTRRA